MSQKTLSYYSIPVRTAANDDSKNQLVKVDHCDSVATVLRQWEMPCGTAAEGVRIRFDPCWKKLCPAYDQHQKLRLRIDTVFECRQATEAKKRLWRQGSPWFICRRTRQQIHQGVPCLQSLFSLLLPVCTQILVNPKPPYFDNGKCLVELRLRE